MKREESRCKLCFAKLTSLSKKAFSLLKTLLSWIILGVIALYKIIISPLFPSSCRYYPTCSSYMAQAVRKYGPFKGGTMGIKRVLRCHPGHPGGHDPVP